MSLPEQLGEGERLFLDTAPIIYYVQRDPRYLDSLAPIFERISAGSLYAVTSPITLAECLVLPVRQGRTELAQLFTDLIVAGPNTSMITIDHEIAIEAARLRARYNLTLGDALQLAASRASGCDAFLTNDKGLTRVESLRILLVSG